MKTYMKPDIELIEFTSETIAAIDMGDISGGGFDYDDGL